MREQFFGKSNKGSSTLEILIAMVILTLVLVSAVLAITGAQTLSVDTQINQEALSLAQSELESARAAARDDFNAVVATTSTQMSGPLTFAKSLSVAQIDLFTKQATSTIAWQSGGRSLSVMLATLFANSVAETGGDTCSSVLSGDWKHPLHHEWDMGQLGVNGNNGNGFGIANLAVFNNRLYVVMYASPNNFKDNLLIFDTSNDASLPPIFRGSVDNDAVSSTGPNAIAIASTSNKIYAYVASPSSFSRGQLQTIDVTNPASPLVVKTFKIPTSAVPSAGTPQSIFYRAGYIYLGLSKITGGGKEFNIIDVGGGTGSPTAPVWVGGYSTSNAINDIYVKNNYAYVATANAENVSILDISNPAAPVRAGGFSPPNIPESNGVGSNHGESVMSVGNVVYLGRTYGTNEFYMLNAATPASLSVTSSLDVGSGNQRSIYGLAVRDYLAFFITNSQFQIWNIANPNAIIPWSSDGTANSFLTLSALGGSGTALDCEGNFIYLAIGSNQGNTKDIIAVISPSP